MAKSGFWFDNSEDTTTVDNPPDHSAPTDVDMGGGGASGQVDPTPNKTAGAPVAATTQKVQDTTPSAVVPPAADQMPGAPTNTNTPNPATGLIGGAMSNYSSSQSSTALPPINIAAPADVHPMTRDVTPNELVQGQLENILKSDSPLMQNARGKAMQYANERGLLNSAMAGGWGEQAVLESAMPIAQADAQTNARQQLTNQDVTNQFGMADKNYGFQSALQKMDIESRQNIASMQASTQQAIAAADASARTWAAQLAASTQLSISDKQLANQLLLSDKDAALRRELNLQGLQAGSLNAYTNQITGVLSAQMPTEDKTTFVNNLNAIWAGSPYLPIKINTSLFPAKTNTDTQTGDPHLGPGGP